MNVNTKKRRGLVILVVLSMLVLFVLLVVTFAIVAGQYRISAEMNAREEQLGNDPQRLLDQAMYQLFRDTQNPASVLRSHSLLRDEFGSDGFAGYVGTAIRLTQTNDQFFQITVDTSRPVVTTDGITLTLISANTQANTLSRTDGTFGGCLLTFTSGPARGLSTRIVDYNYDATSGHVYRLRLVSLKNAQGNFVVPSTLVGSRFVVNGRPFNGTGMGYNSSTGRTDMADSTLGEPVALLPNYAFTRAASNPMAGGVDENYDAADFQNMHLAAMLADASQILPSFHRPQLIRYWQNHSSGVWNQGGSGSLTSAAKALRRRVVLRPLGGGNGDHPKFDGSNPNFNFLTGPWDVDNDGDGIADSIWLDLGMPIITDKDGRRYKPLFAILCKDLDGNLNVNAHGTPASERPVLPTDVAVAGTSTTTAVLPAGQGYGPPEINLRGFMTAGQFTNLLRERYNGASPGAPGLDYMPAARFSQYPSTYFSGSTYSSFRSPPDLWGEFRMGISILGQPQYAQLPGVDLRADSPYELDLSRHRFGGENINRLPNSEPDTPFTSVDLERILRFHDLDTQTLSTRLTQFGAFGSEVARRLITTDSYHVPSTSAVVIRDPNPNPMPNQSSVRVQATSIIQWLRHRIMRVLGYTGALMPSEEATINNIIRDILAEEMLVGLPMDINRPFGNGQDDTPAGQPGSLVVDEPEEAYSLIAERAWPNVADPSYAGVRFNHTNGRDVNKDGVFNDSNTSAAQDPLLARQLFARFLYVLALTVMDDGTTTVPNSNTAREIAQWAINVVDFRDADSIMTPFEFDPNPFDGWSYDGIVNGYLGMSSSDDDPNRSNLVWGCERPELLITESFAFHSRRTEDLTSDASGKDTTDNNNPDDDFDQQRLPRSGTFIELYNPWKGTDTELAPPGEFYGNTDGVQLNAVTQGGSPVWRLFIDEQLTNSPVDPYRNTNPSGDKAVYFIPLTNGMAAANNNKLPGDVRRRYFTSLPVARLRPGYYAVVGSGGIQQNNQRVTIIADVDTSVIPSPTPADHRRIGLAPAWDPTVGNQVFIYPGSGEPVEVPTQPAVGIAIDQSDLAAGGGSFPLTFSLSEPRNGYPNFTNTNPGPNGEMYDPALEMFVPPLDTPFDKTREYAQEAYRTNGTTAPFRRIHLQRLANPIGDWHPTGNPYMTIDTMLADLVAFNGLQRPGAGEGMDVTNNNREFNFLTFQRGESDASPTSAAGRKLWRREPLRLRADSGTREDSVRQDMMRIHYFDYHLKHTFGDLNQKYKAATGSALPWLTWNNRPFVSQYELMQVPRYGAFDILANFNFPADIPPPPAPYATPNSRFPHLTNYFENKDPTAIGGSPDQSKHLYRLFDYTHVPSRFVASDTILSPVSFQAGTGTEYFKPPFNRISEYRYPGFVNLNSIYSPLVWNAVRNDLGETGFGFIEFVNSRRGYDGGVSGNGAVFWPSPSANSPTFFANPFRGPFGGSLVPLSNSLNYLDHENLDVTLLRREPTATPGAGTPDLTGDGLFASHRSGIHSDGSRNSYFRYRPLHRLGSMTTTRSNVYAVWITVGYFEVEPNLVPSNSGTPQLVVDEAHPDGMRLGQEVGIMTGDVKRHRAFYILDRSIPVAFEPGENHNVDEAVLLRRFIE